MEIKCEFKNIIWNQSGILYTSKIISASIKESNQEVKSFTGQHEAEKSDCDVEAIWFLNTEVHFMSRGIENFFPNLKAVSIYNCGLKEITREDLVGLENIEGLSLRSNQLKSLPNDLFEGMKKLKWISFSNNKLEFVSSQLLQPILENHLEFVSFWENPTINAAFEGSKVNPSGRYVDLPDLMKLIDEKFKKPSKIENQIKSSTIGESLKMFNANLIRGLNNFWSSGKFFDFTIIVGDKKFKVHKIVLAMQSEYFAEIFEKTDDAIAELKIENISFEAIGAVLNWMYTGKIPDTKNSAEVFSIAMKLKISALKPIAEELAQVYLNEKNAMEILKLGLQHNCEKMKKSAYELIKKFLADSDLEDEMMNDPETLKKLVEVKKNYEEIKKMKLN